jgi:hypothetical protein
MATEFYEILQALRGSALDWSNTLQWYCHFKSGCPFTNDPHTDQPSALPFHKTTAHVIDLIHEHQHLTIRDTAAGFSISLTMCQMFVT